MKSLLMSTINVSADKAQVIVLCAGSNTITATNGSTTKTAYGNEDIFYFTTLSTGNWTITAKNGIYETSKVISVTSNTFNKVIQIAYNTIPEFTYDGGTYEIVDDNDNIITSSTGNWKIRFLTSGTLKFTNLNGAYDGIDVFLVGGGGGGGATTTDSRHCGGAGGGGYTKTIKNVTVSLNGIYNIVIGSGGSGSNFGSSSGTGESGGITSAFADNVNGGFGGANYHGTGGNGGSGGGGGGYSSPGGSGGTNGSNGEEGGSNGLGGTGQGTTTKEFGESTGKLYAGGGGGGGSPAGTGGNGGGGNGAINGSNKPENGVTNTGGGGGAAGAYAKVAGGNGGSGIVVIRNKR